MKSLTPFLLCLCLGLGLDAGASDAVLARNKWTTVTKSDFDQEIGRIPKDQQFQFLSSAERVARTVENILVTKTLAEQARQSGLQDDPKVKADIAAATERILAVARTERAEAELVTPDFGKRAQELYLAETRRYAEKDIVHAMHILVDARCRAEEAARARALEAREELASGKRFADVAKKYSDDPSVAKNGGDIGPMVIDSLSPAFVEAAMALKPGELSQPVRTPFGYHIIRVESLKKGRQLAFGEVRESIIAEARETWLKQQRKEFVARITGDPELKLDLDAIQALKTNIDAPAVPATPPR